LAELKKLKSNKPIYTDSITAISWVRRKKCNTKLERTNENENLFILVDRAIVWLNSNSYKTRILKWKTKIWGEIPADFGRK
jgi:ribonuclease HI